MQFPWRKTFQNSKPVNYEDRMRKYTTEMQVNKHLLSSSFCSPWMVDKPIKQSVKWQKLVNIKNQNMLTKMCYLDEFTLTAF